MKVLVTGASGRLGRAVRRRLESRSGVEAVFLRHYTDGSRGDDAFAFDMTDMPRLHSVVSTARPDVIIHLASITGLACDNDPQLANAINVEVTIALAGIAAELGTERIVFTSTAAVYGDGYREPIHEGTPLRGASSYASTKQLAERGLVKCVETSANLSAVVLRIFNLYGDDFTDSVVQKLLTSTPDQPVRIHGLDRFVRDYVHVDDVVDAIMACVDAELTARHQVINIGTGVPTSNRALLERLGERRELYFDLVGEERESYSCADITRAADILDFAPRLRL
ncbi:NAD-dependent epimerase/dehydratase family protein [Luethyella okanaganae]|uniref:NAD-dependent epimerase/dehydratase family protein n=1 Tax=Luethyella okanaganae TaxID=69372 RepID=A0ABW1VAU0_9MICO